MKKAIYIIDYDSDDEFVESDYINITNKDLVKIVNHIRNELFNNGTPYEELLQQMINKGELASTK